MKLSVPVLIHLIAIVLAFVISVATLVAANSTDAKLAGAAATVLSIAGLLKKIVDMEDGKDAVKTSVNVLIPAITAAAAGNPMQENAVKNTLATIPSDATAEARPKR